MNGEGRRVLLNVDNLTCTLANGEILFNGLSFNLKPAETLLIEGGSGMGKSSLLMGIKGLFSTQKIFTGTLTYDNRPMDETREKQIGLVLQNPHAQMISTLVWEELISGRPDLSNATVMHTIHDKPPGGTNHESFDAVMPCNSSQRDCDSRSSSPSHVPSLLEQTISILGIEHLLEKPVRHLSAGEKHLVAIGAAAMMRPSILLMDEPFLYLDQKNITKVISYIHCLKQNGIAQIITSHPGVVDHAIFNKTFSMAQPPRFRHSDEKTKPPCPPHPAKSTIELNHVSYTHENGTPILNQFSLILESGKELWITGENGSGKTTLLSLLSKAREPDEGRVCHCCNTRRADMAMGKDIESGHVGSSNRAKHEKSPETCPDDEGHRKRNSTLLKFQMITQNPDRFFFAPQLIHEMKAAMLGKKGADQPLTAAQQKSIKTLLHRVGLKGKEKITPLSLSFGEKIRLAAAQAWLLQPDFIFVDDILGFLDPDERIFLMDFLRQCRDHHGCGLIFTSSRGIYRENDETPLISLEPSSLHDLETSHNLVTRDMAIHSSTSFTRKKPKKKEPSRPFWKRFFRWMRLPAFEYVVGNSWLHKANPMVKMGMAVLFWATLYKAGDGWFPIIGLLISFYYLSGGMGTKRLLADSRFFLLQTALFTLFMPLFRWDVHAAKEGMLAGIRVWLFFIPVIVMMRTTTVAQWLESFGRMISKRKKRAVGIAMGLLPVLMNDAKEILHAQKHKGYLPQRRDFFKPKQLFYGLKSLFIPLLIMMEESAELAGLAVKLRGHDE